MHSLLLHFQRVENTSDAYVVQDVCYTLYNCFICSCFCLPRVEQLQVDIKETVNATEDKAVDILCTVKGNPIPPDVTWYTAAKNDSFKQILSNDMTYNFTSAEPGGEFARVFTLTIMNPKVTMNHRQYRCSAFDRISNSTITSTNATLSVTKGQSH